MPAVVLELSASVAFFVEEAIESEREAKDVLGLLDLLVNAIVFRDDGVLTSHVFVGVATGRVDDG